MVNLYPYCTKCEKDLTEGEKKMNMEANSLFYPICESCLNKNIKKFGETIDKILDK